MPEPTATAYDFSADLRAAIQAYALPGLQCSPTAEDHEADAPEAAEELALIRACGLPGFAQSGDAPQSGCGDDFPDDLRAAIRTHGVAGWVCSPAADDHETVPYALARPRGG
jgi:hypothetical protein